MVEHINNSMMFNRCIQSNSTVIVDFYAEWCGPCKAIAPFFEQLASQHPNIKCVKVDVDKGADIAQQYGVRAMPTFILIKNGKEEERFSGADRNHLQNFFNTTTSAYSGSGRTLGSHSAVSGNHSNSSVMKTLAVVGIIFFTIILLSKFTK